MSSLNNYVMGINMSNHDRSVVISRNGKILAAISEERLDRRKHSQGFYSDQACNIILPPMSSINYCLEKVNIKIDELDKIVVGRSIQSALKAAKQYIPILDKSKIVESKLPSHHYSHAVSAYYPSGFEDALVFVADEQGHWINEHYYEKLSVYIVKNGKFSVYHKQYGDYYNISLGMFYDLFSYILGFSDGGLPAAGKTMGLAAYGEYKKDVPKLLNVNNLKINIDIDKIIQYLQENLILDHEFVLKRVVKPISHSTVLDELKKYLKIIHWESEAAKNIAWKAQQELEDSVVELVKNVVEETGIKKICFAGGIFLNSVVNSKIYNEVRPDGIFIQPASTDDGTAIGLSLIGYYDYLQGTQRASFDNVYFGRSYQDDEVKGLFDHENLRYSIRKDISSKIANHLIQNKVVAFMDTELGCEFGPRALGSRSILACATSKEIKDKVNLDIKRRESFRPLAPVVLEEKCSHYFDIDIPSPYMLLVAPIIDKTLVGVEHADSTARVQTINQTQNPRLYSIINEYGCLSDKYVIMNTSFNVNGEPLVETPLDAIYSFFTSDLDVLFVGRYEIKKSDYSKEELEDLRIKYTKKDPTSLLKLAQWEMDKKGNLKRIEKYLNLIRDTFLFNQTSDEQKIQLFYLYSLLYSDKKDYKRAVEYLDKIILSNNSALSENLADIMLQRTAMLRAMEHDISLENKIVKELQLYEDLGVVKYVSSKV